MSERFSERQGFIPPDGEITVRNDAPYELRGIVIELTYETGLSPTALRTLVCRTLRRRPNPNNWSEWPNIAGEVEELLDNCEWFEVYDIIEAISRYLSEHRHDNAVRGAACFEEQLNRYFRKAGIGWQLAGGEIGIRGPEAFEESVRNARQTLEHAGRETAAHEIHEALRDLSRRPEPDVTGAIQHAMAALECVARDVCGEPRPTLGELLRRHPELLPAPLDQVVERAWGYASERGRHLREGREPDLADAELVVGLASTVATYLSKRFA
jgi:hypothetical protein